MKDFVVTERMIRKGHNIANMLTDISVVSSMSGLGGCLTYEAWLEKHKDCTDIAIAQEYTKAGARSVELIFKAMWREHLREQQDEATVSSVVISEVEPVQESTKEAAMKLSEKVKEKLGEVIEAWAEENLHGRPNVLGFAVYSSLEQELLKKQEEIEAKFPR